MGLTKLVLLFVFGTLATSYGFNHLVPWDKEVVYDWNALVKAGTHFPASHASQFVLHGKVHVQADNNATHVQLTDLTYKLYNGILDHVHEHEAHDLPVPPEVQDLHRTFKIVHDPDGNVIGIATNTHEKEFSRNIKKAIASILQVNHTVIEHNPNVPHAFVSKEHSIYGWGNVDYNVLPYDDFIEIHKMHDMRDTSHLYDYFMTNTEPLDCSLSYEEPITHDSQKRYIVVKQDGHNIVKHIVATGGVYYHPHQAHSDSHYVLVNQTFNLLHILPISQKLHVEDEHYDHHLSYHVFDENYHGESVPDITNGRHVTHWDKLVTQVQPMFDDIWKYLHEDHLHTHTPDTKRGQLVNRVRHLLMYFDLHHLEELDKTLGQKSDKHHVEVFHHVLPLIGTKAAVLFIKKLVLNKAVSDEVAVDLLQHLPENIVQPTEELLHELEQLIHLDDNVHWNVRKTAIVTFASVIHKSSVYLNRLRHIHVQREQGLHTHEESSHTHEHTMHDHADIQKVFEKYVAEYVNRVKTAQEYKVVTVWMQGLYNMKLHSIVHHLAPAIRGEWWHESHWRSLALWAVHPSIHSHGSNEIIELFWPIFTNRQEHTELRILAYYLMMETHPSVSRLTNIYWYLMTEPNEEVYHFHYTYVNAHLHSDEPCHEQFRMHLAQIKQYMQPPSHGVSSAHLHDFQDDNFGFSGGSSSIMIHSNDSQTLVVKTSHQLAHVYHENYKFIVKLHGLKQKIHDIAHLAESFSADHSKISHNDNAFIEVIIVRHQHVVHSLYYDKNNLHEINGLVDFLTKDKQSFSKHLLHISYDIFHKAIIPTDLGIPAVWEYLLPSVHKNDLEITKEVTNKIVKVHVDNRHVTWVHYRHGLSFYNPISDIWHGVNRYHAFDHVAPLHFDITLNPLQQSFQLSWRKHTDGHLDVTGFRSHVKQMVFIKDDHHRNVLIQSSPHSQEWVVVSHGDQYRNDYTLMENDDLNTGHRWHASVYDSGYHVSNGSFDHILSLFGQSQHNEEQTLASSVFTSWMHFQHYIWHMPEPGMYGLLIRAEPSHDHAVSNIDLSVRLNEEKINSDYVYAEGSKRSARLTYSVKNKEQILKTWDINAMLDMNPGHTVNNLKMHLTRIIPGQKDYKVCVDGVKKWTNNDVSGHINIAMSQTPDGKCLKDDTVIDVTMIGQRSHEQEHEHHVYGSCHYPIPYTVQPYHTLHCLASHSSVRHYVYNVKTANVPTEFRKWFERLWDHVKGYYISFYDYQEEHNVNIGDHTLKVDVVFPMQGKEVDVHMTTPHHIYRLTGVPTNHLQSVCVFPDSLVYSQNFIEAHKYGTVDHCVIHHDHHHFNNYNVHKAVPNDWTLFVGDAEQNPQKAVYIKHVAETKIAIRVVDHTHVLEIVPHGETHQITVDGQEVAGEHRHNEDWMALHVFRHEVGHPVTVMFPHLGVHIEYDTHHVVVIVPKSDDHHWHGHCYEQ